MNEIDIYAVGLLRDLRDFTHSPKPLRERLRRLVHDLGIGITYRIRRRQWRALRNYFNGYLAEHSALGARAGHGWTRGRAYNDLMRHLTEEYIDAR